MNSSSPFIEETKFGNWFLKTDVWRVSVLCRALNDLNRLTPANNIPIKPRILDVGCGFGHSFGELSKRFSPEFILGVDADPGLFERASNAAKNCISEVRLHPANAAKMDLPDAEFDIIFGEGISKAYEILDLATENNLIKKYEPKYNVKLITLIHLVSKLFHVPIRT